MHKNTFHQLLQKQTVYSLTIASIVLIVFLFLFIRLHLLVILERKIDEQTQAAIQELFVDGSLHDDTSFDAVQAVMIEKNLNTLKSKHLFVRDVTILDSLGNYLFGDNILEPSSEQSLFARISDGDSLISKNIGFSSRLSYYAISLNEAGGNVSLGRGKLYARTFFDYAPVVPYVLFFAAVIIIAVLVSLWLALAINHRLSRRITEPIILLAAVMNAVTNDGSFGRVRDIELSGIAEVDSLIQTYSSMSDELSDRFMQLEDVNNKLKTSNVLFQNATDKLQRLIELTSNLSESVLSEDSSFLHELLHTAMNLIPRVDYGSVYVIEDGQIEFVEAVGHDIEKLAKVKVEFAGTNDVIIVENILDRYKIDLSNKEHNGMIEGSKPIKSTMVVRLKMMGKLMGGISLDISDNSSEVFQSEDIDTMRALANLATAFLSLREHVGRQQRLQEEIILSLINTLEVHNAYLKGHSENVARTAVNIAQALGLDDEACDNVYWSALLHDIGKLLVSNEILNKPTRLLEDEYNEIKRHSEYGYRILDSAENLRDIAKYVRHHHERWDGKGYPDGLDGENIPLLSRIICVADAWDAMRSERSYRKGLSIEIAKSEISNNMGKQFDPHIAKVFLENADTLVRKKPGTEIIEQKW